MNVLIIYMEISHLHYGMNTIIRYYVQVIIWDSNLQYANARDCNLQSANIQRSNMKYSYLKDANLAEASILNSDLRGVHFNGADLSNVTLSSCNAENSNFADATLKNTRILKMSFNENTIMPDGRRWLPELDL